MENRVDQAKQDKTHAMEKSEQARAKSAGGLPREGPTPVHYAPAVSSEDEPKEQPNSDRFHSEQAASHAKSTP